MCILKCDVKKKLIFFLCVVSLTDEIIEDFDTDKDLSGMSFYSL